MNDQLQFINPGYFERLAIKPRIKRLPVGDVWKWICRTRWGCGFGDSVQEAWDNWQKYGRATER